MQVDKGREESLMARSQGDRGLEEQLESPPRIPVSLHEVRTHRTFLLFFVLAQVFPSSPMGHMMETGSVSRRMWTSPHRSSNPRLASLSAPLSEISFT